MFDSTFQLLSAHPVTLPAFVFALWIGYRLVRRGRSVLAALAKLAAVIALVPLFGSPFLAQFTDHWIFERLAEAVIATVSSAAMLVVELVDALFAAWLELVLVVSRGLWSGAQGSIASAVPALSAVGFVLAVFAFQFVAGAALLAVAYRAAREAGANGWLLGAGSVLFVSGLFAALIGFETWQLNQSALAAGLVAATLGLTLGVLSMVVLLRPDFGGEAMLPGLKERLDWSANSGPEEVRR